MRLGTTNLSVTQPGRRRGRGIVLPGGGGGLSLPARTFTFKYHIFGSAFSGIYLFWFRTYPSTQATTLWYQGSQTHTSSTDPWLTKNISMSSRVGEQGYFTFVIRRGSGTAGDAALDEINWVDGSSTVTDYSGDTASRRGMWRHNPANNSSAVGAAYGGHTYLLTTATNGRWSYDPGGGTPSGGTGPSSAANGDPNKAYIYFESSYGTAGTWTSLRPAGAITI